MNIELAHITIRKLFEGYENEDENGVVGYNGKLDIRPPFQREFVYDEKRQKAVIDTIIKEFPLNIMYWGVKSDGNYEIIDGQQRTMSICEYINHEFSYRFSHDLLYFDNLPDDIQKKVLDYKLTIYLCSGKNSEKLDWFKIVNIAGEKLTNQELLNAVYAGSYVSDAKRYFSKTGCAAYGLASSYMTGKPIRQDYLEAVIKWISNNSIQDYMGIHQHDKDAKELWEYFQAVVNWVELVFYTKRPIMKGVEWGLFYNKYKDQSFDSDKIEQEIKELILDDDVQKKSSIYEYILTRDEKCLNIRAFSPAQKLKAYELQAGICNICKEKFEQNKMEADHITPWADGGRTIQENCQMLCRDCNLYKSDK